MRSARLIETVPTNHFTPVKWLEIHQIARVKKHNWRDETKRIEAVKKSAVSGNQA